MLTKNDRQNLIEDFKQVFATKDEICDVKKGLKGLENKIVEFKDEILAKIEDLDDNSTIDQDIHDQVERHETRLETIEKHLNIAS